LRLGLITAVIALVFDQLTKYAVRNFVLADQPMIEVMPFFNLVTAWNTGVSFSMFDSYGVPGTVVLVILAVIIIGMLVRWLKDEKIPLLQFAIGLIIGGALGNVIDRLYFGAVFDFVDLYFRDMHWPAFNAADSFICIGAMIVILHSLFIGEQKENPELEGAVAKKVKKKEKRKK